MILYKRNAQGKPLVWEGIQNGNKLDIHYGLVGGNLHKESILVTSKKVNELESRIKAKRKEGYKTLEELKDNSPSKVTSSIYPVASDGSLRGEYLLSYLHTYLPKYSTTSEGFVLPMLAKLLENDRPFNKCSEFLGQWKIDGLRCLIGLEETDDIFQPVRCTYHSREGEDWTHKMSWMDELILGNISSELLDLLLDEGAYLDGELYLPGHSVNEINSFVKNTTLPEHYKLQYWCYDIACENMSAEARCIFLRKNMNGYANIMSRRSHLENTKQLVLLPTIGVSSFDEATTIRNGFINLGFEGLILRNPLAEYQFDKRNQAMLKYKKVDDGKFTIIDIIPEHKRKNLPIFVCRNDINDELFEVSINDTHENQEYYLANKDKYIGKKLLVEFRARSGVNQVPFHSRGISIIL